VNDRFGNDDRWKNVAKHQLADVVSPERLDGFLDAHARDIDIVVHMGAISATTERNVDRILHDNFVLSRNLWLRSVEHGWRLIYASSAATYGGGEAGFHDDASPEALARLRPLNPYGWSKHLFDRWVAGRLSSGTAAPPQWAGLKFFNVYGPNEYHKGDMQSVVAKIYPAVASGKPVRLFRSHHPDFEDGGQSRDFIFVADCVRVIEWLVANEHATGLFNVGTGRDRSFADLARAVFDALDRPVAIEYVDTPVEIRDRYQYFTQADMTKLREAGFAEPFTELEVGVTEYVRRYLATDDPYL
jgi:ADP-L-glycero-D-manno-heptose 6-epimerase